MLKTWQYLRWAGSLRPFPRTCTPDFSSMALLHRPLIPWRCTVSSLVWVLYLKVVIPTCDYLPWSVGSTSHCFWLLCLKICLGGRGQLERVLLIWDQFSVGPVEGQSTWVEWAADFHHNNFQSITFLRNLKGSTPLWRRFVFLPVILQFYAQGLLSTQIRSHFCAVFQTRVPQDTYRSIRASVDMSQFQKCTDAPVLSFE